MRKALTACAAAALIAAATVAVPTDAQARGGRIAAGIIGGLAAGAILGGILAPHYYYGPGPAYYDGPPCYLRRERVWVPGWGWRIRRVEVCY